MQTMIAAALLAAATQAPPSVQTGRAMARAAGCAVDADDPRVDVRPAPGVPGASVVATLSGAGGGDLGDLCVALVRRDGARTVAVATLADGPVAIEDEIGGLSSGSVSVDGAAYAIGRGEKAIGVRVSGVYVSTSTQVAWTTLHLLRRTGAALTPILAVKVDDETTDKTEGGGTDGQRWTVRMDDATHLGIRDVVTTGPGGRKRRYVWDGRAYRPR